MNLKQKGPAPAGPILALVCGLAVATPASAAPPVIRVDGSSTVFPITEAVAEEFQKARKGTVRVTVGISGTGGGFRKFCRGEIDVANASRPIQKKEMDDCVKTGVRYYEMPVAYDALTVIVNPENRFVGSLTVAELRKIWEPSAQGRISTWKDVNPAWPAQKITLYGAGADSGTFDYFTEAIVGKARSSRGDFTASEDDNVLVQGISGDRGALGYFGFAYYSENRRKLRAVAIDNGKGPVAPTPETVENGTYQPLSRPVFIYVSEKSLERPEVREFVEFYMKNAPQLVREVKYIPLPARAYAGNLEHLAKRKLGTVFGGRSEVGLTIDELIKREAQL